MVSEIYLQSDKTPSPMSPTSPFRILGSAQRGYSVLGGGGHSPWFWVPTEKRTPGAVAVGWKRGGCQRPKNSQKGVLSEGHFLLGLWLLVWLVQGKHPGLAIISVLAIAIRVIVSGQLKMMSTGGKPR